jgi:hypothetical protein
VRGGFRVPVHRASGASVRSDRHEEEDEDDSGQFVNRPCYVFNPSLPMFRDDRRCTHCRFYLTASCPHIDDFIDDVEDLSPD